MGAAEEIRRGRPRNPDIDQAILSATLKRLATDGYTAMSIAAIAADAGVTKPALYRRWGCKADLATAALSQLQSEEPAPRSGDTAADLRKVLENFRRNLLRPRGLAMIGMLLSEEHNAPELLSLFRERITKNRRRLLTAILEVARDRGELRNNADIDAAVNLMVGSFYGKYIADGRIPTSWPRRVVDQTLTGLLKRPGLR